MKNIIELNQKEISAISGGKDGDESGRSFWSYARETVFDAGFFVLGYFACLHKDRINIANIKALFHHKAPNLHVESIEEIKKSE